MKKVFTALALLAMPFAVMAAGDPLHAFDEVKLELPCISLEAYAKQDPLTTLSEKGISFQRPVHARSEKRKLVSDMPMLAPKANVDPNMPIKAPDAAVDYKLMVKPPGVESAK